MKIEKINQNSYRIRKRYKGKLYTLMLDYKPTQKEAMLLLAEKMEQDFDLDGRLTFKTAFKDYCESKSHVLSPTTILNYESIFRNMPDELRDARVSDIDIKLVQNAVNEYSLNRSPKSTKNFYGLVTAVLSFARPNLRMKCTLPQPKKNEVYIPTQSDVKRLFEAISGSDYEVAVRLAAIGLRRSEICALTMQDLDGNMLTINKAMVKNNKREWIIKKSNKTTNSTRVIYVDDNLVQFIRDKGMYVGNPDCISHYIKRVQKRLDMPQFSLHKLRHFYASYAHSLGIPDAFIMEAGGWSSTNCLNAVYKHALTDKNKEMQSKVANMISAL